MCTNIQLSWLYKLGWPPVLQADPGASHHFCGLSMMALRPPSLWLAEGPQQSHPSPQIDQNCSLITLIKFKESIDPCVIKHGLMVSLGLIRVIKMWFQAI